MPFLSIEFTLFFIIFFPLYWLCRFSPKCQNFLLLLASGYWLWQLNPWFLVTVFSFAIIINWFAQRISNEQRIGWKKGYFITAIVITLLNLGVFKYFDFFRPQLQNWFGQQVIDIVLPLGVSYYTFQAIAYLVELYRGENIKLTMFETLLHFSFFPTITSGPIARVGKMKSIYGEHQGMAVQLKTVVPRQIIRPALAISLVLLGIAKKWWLSGTLGEQFVDPVFENPLQYQGIEVLNAMYGYTAQLFLDFSGYTDLVIGIAMLLGFDLPKNFNMPLRAFNIRDFWNRWHITLSTWIRDYIYIPLGGSRNGWGRTQVNLVIAMLLSGIWHGSGWNFLLWGGLHGIALVILNITDHFFGRERLVITPLGKVLGIIVTIHFVVFSFVVFRTSSLSDANLMFTALWQNFSLQSNLQNWLVLGLFIFTLIVYPLFVRGFEAFVRLLENLPYWLWFVPITLIMMLIIVLAPSGIPGFIYANF
ncbi:alginate O-acetyltransferase [Mergibacter septicus]|uniref:Probable alginate O-acetylase n=1 Tax=Mergibacter septicus TaxID=221402 RepID=A0A8E3MGB4_9PAST|nr:MBOAT family O-acyltransferase [Mergibacter septicus]AWX15574.1 alginate O-acetyltransferase [Mergibacter septicus]QDJ14828.1 alginate O-acetyltransferase [Mergibacter septicus]UTU47744.1 MBOAT family protein [Mergibacter septicus]WMR96650.1 MBOAT family O-acyltransferase [Mergibacter septicus]